eukprot:scaffold32257_cov56-Phaeocystis_antarctica.AAC.5
MEGLHGRRCSAPAGVVSSGGELGRGGLRLAAEASGSDMGHLAQQQSAAEAERFGRASQLRVGRAAHGEGEAAAEPREAVHVRERGEPVVDGDDGGTHHADSQRVCRARLWSLLRLQQVPAPGACTKLGLGPGLGPGQGPGLGLGPGLGSGCGLTTPLTTREGDDQATPQGAGVLLVRHALKAEPEGQADAAGDEAPDVRQRVRAGCERHRDEVEHHRAHAAGDHQVARRAELHGGVPLLDRGDGEAQRVARGHVDHKAHDMQQEQRRVQSLLSAHPLLLHATRHQERRQRGRAGSQVGRGWHAPSAAPQPAAIAGAVLAMSRLIELSVFALRTSSANTLKLQGTR